MNWQQLLKQALVPKSVSTRHRSLAPGLYHYPRERDGQYVRFHLRVDPGGRGILIAGAAEAVQLSPPDAWLAAELLRDRSVAEPFRDGPSGIGPDQAARVQQLLDRLADPAHRFPILNLPDPDIEGKLTLSAPFQADFALADPDAVKPIIERLWAAGIPHLRLLVECCEQASLLRDAVLWAEDLGMITGLRTTAARLAEDRLLDEVAEAGIDYVVLPWAGADELHEHVLGAADLAAVPPVIEQIRRREVTPVLQIPLVATSFDLLEEHLDQMLAWDIAHIEVFAIATATAPSQQQDEHEKLRPVPSEHLRQLAAWMEDYANDHAMQVIWLPPQGLAAAESVADVARHGPRAGGDIAIRVEANGDVLPPRGRRQVSGNLLEQPFAEIWQQDAFRPYRLLDWSRQYCEPCPRLAICTAGCPADPAGWAT